MGNRLSAPGEKFLKLIKRGYSRQYAMAKAGVSLASSYRLLLLMRVKPRNK
jgi:hypothetical protein